MIVIDMRGDASIAESYAKPPPWQFMADRGEVDWRLAVLDRQGPGTRNLVGGQALEERLAAAPERGRFTCGLVFGG